MSLRISTPAAEGFYQGSKYLKQQVLMSGEELSQLFETLGSFEIYSLTNMGDGAPIDQKKFVEEYRSWIEGLKEGRVPTDLALRTILAAAITCERDALWKQEVPGGRFLIKMAKPVVHVQAHFFSYSPIDDEFRPMTIGQSSIFWGLQFSFPQIYQEPKTMEFLNAADSPNAEIFQKIRLWVRDATRPTPFVVEGKKTNVPIRLGKNCFSWIGSHPQLIAQKIGVYAN